MTSESRRLLAGRFALDTRIGAGNYAEIFRARDTDTGDLVAVKTLRHEHNNEQQAISLFEQEGKVGSAISHVNVVKIHSHGEEEGTRFIVMELVKGISLRRRLTLVGSLTIAEALRIINAVLSGLEAIHAAGYIHRDIKPRNILLDASGTPKITDFGISLSPDEPRRGEGKLALGTAAYIAPEQAAGQEVGEQADVYSAGAVLFEMLTGEAPFPGDDPIEVMNRHLFEPPRDPRTLNPEISPALSAVILRALAKEPAARFRSARRMREALEMLTPVEAPAAPRRSLIPSDKMAWTAPIAASNRFPDRLAGVPILTTFVSALLLVVLIIVLVLALVSANVGASPSESRISSSSPPNASIGPQSSSSDPQQAQESAAPITWTSPGPAIDTSLADPVNDPFAHAKASAIATAPAGNTSVTSDAPQSTSSDPTASTSQVGPVAKDISTAAPIVEVTGTKASHHASWHADDHGHQPGSTASSNGSDKTHRSVNAASPQTDQHGHANGWGIHGSRGKSPIQKGGPNASRQHD